MLYPDLVRKIHRELTKICSPKALVLFGGSYLYGEANENSDLDFYVVASALYFFRRGRWRKAVIEIQKDFPRVPLNIMFVPRIFYKHGWYYIFGRDLENKTHVSPLNKGIVIRNCLKLGFYHLLRAQSSNPNDCRTLLIKSAQQAAVAALVISGEQRGRPLFSTACLTTSPILLQNFPELIKILQAKKTNFPLPESTFQDIVSALKILYSISEKPYWNFSLFNYFIYNTKFLLKKNTTFLLKNPDKYLVRKLIRLIDARAPSQEEIKEIEKLVFPVIML